MEFVQKLWVSYFHQEVSDPSRDKLTINWNRDKQLDDNGET